MNNIEFTDVVLGVSYGDEGKGVCVFDLLKTHSHNLCVKFNGGPNAGNTIHIKITEFSNKSSSLSLSPSSPSYKKMVLHMLPIGMAKPDVYNLISSDCVIDIDKLRKELEYVKSYGIDITGRIFISKACHIITQENIDYDCQNNLVGTTGSGIAPTYSNKMLRIGKRVEDYAEEFKEMGVQVVDMRKFWTPEFMRDNFNNNIKGVLLQGSQGFELDINWCGNYPYCTSSTCTLGGAVNTGFPIKTLRNIYGIAKIYDTYVGKMAFQPTDDNDLIRIGEHGHEFGSTTGRRRQCNYLNLDTLKEGLLINNCNICIINKVDIVEDLGLFKLYNKGELKTYNNLDDMKQFILQELSLINESMEVIFSSSPYQI